jgi:type I restriction enzyme M protein
MDLRRWGKKDEKKFIELSNKEIETICGNYHNWQQENQNNAYVDVSEFCYSANLKELEENDFSLIPSKYIKFEEGERGLDFNTEMTRVRDEFREILKAEIESQQQLADAFKKLGYEL